MLLRVAAIFLQIIPDLPNPVTMIFPEQAAARSTARRKDSSHAAHEAPDRIRFRFQNTNGRRQRRTRIAAPSRRPPDRAAYAKDVLHQTRKHLQVQRIRPVRQRLGGIVMHFEEKPVHADRGARAGQIRNVLRDCRRICPPVLRATARCASRRKPPAARKSA